MHSVHKMRAIASDRVAWSAVCLFVTFASSAIMSQPIEMPFGD